MAEPARPQPQGRRSPRRRIIGIVRQDGSLGRQRLTRQAAPITEEEADSEPLDTEPYLSSVPGTAAEAIDDSNDTLQAIDGGGESTERRRDHLKPVSDARELREKEENPSADEYGGTAMENLRENLGFNYTGEKENKKRANKFLGSSRLRKRAAIATSIAGGSLALAIIGFLLMLPLKIESFVQMIEGRASASTVQAMGDMQGKLISGFIRRNVIPAFDQKGCRSTIDPSCVVITNGSANPIEKLYAAWSQNNLQRKLAEKHGIIIGKNDKTGELYMTVKGKSVGTPNEWERLRRGEITLSNLDATPTTRREVRNAIAESTKWYQAYSRYKYGKLLETRFNIKRCIIGCNLRDDFTDAKEAKLLAGKLWLTQRVGGLVGETYGIMIQCALDIDRCSTAITPTTNGTEPRSEFHRKIDDALRAYRSKYGVESLAKLYERAADLNRLGPSRYVAKLIAERVGTFLGIKAAGETVTKVLDKAVPLIGQVHAVIQLRRFLDVGPDVARYMSYAAKAAPAASMFAMYQSSASEMKKGHVDAAELGALADTLSEGQDMTKHPSYQKYQPQLAANGSSLFADFASLLSGRASAAEPTQWSFVCDDGKKIPIGQDKCYEEGLTNPGAIIDVASTVRKDPIIENYFRVVGATSMPIIVVDNIYKLTLDWAGGVTNAVFEKICIGPCSTVKDFISGKFGEFIGWIIEKGTANPYINMTGGRIMAMSTAGAEVVFEKADMLLNGAAPISDTAYRDIQNRRIADEQADFASRSLLSRVAATDTPYSLLSRTALALPSRSAAARNTIDSLLTNPLDRVAAGFGSLLQSKRASAFDTVEASTFGVTHYGHSVIPDDPVAYWAANCANRDFVGEYMGSMVQDPLTGEATSTREEPCLLILSSVQASGSLFDAGLIPRGSGTTEAGNETAPTPGQSSGGFISPIKNYQLPITNCWRQPGHAGIDLPTPVGTDLVAVANGTVVETGGPGGAAGNYIMIQTAANQWVNYQHLSQINVRSGPVSQGQVIGLSGNTGNSTGPHLHFGVTDAQTLSDRRSGQNSINPQPLLSGAGLTFACTNR